MNLPIAPLSAAAFGALAALGVIAMPVDTLAALVMDSGLPSVLQAAEPPLGLTARAMLAGGAGAVAALFAWFLAFIILGSRGISIGESADEDEARVPVIRRADAHPDAPPRQPLLATRDLGTPFLDIRAAEPQEEVEEPLTLALPVGPMADSSPEPPAMAVEEPAPAPISARVEQPLPQDFDQPLAAFDPQAIPEVAQPKPVPLAPLRRAPRPAVFDETERFEIFELTPPVRTTPRQAPDWVPAYEPMTRPETDASVHALLERLERGVVRNGLGRASRPAPRSRDPERGLEEALVTLRNLARRA